jgi:hypothetical protein
MGEITAFVSKSELERLRLIREARAIYDSIFPPAHAVGAQPLGRFGKADTTEQDRPAPSKENVRTTERS